MKLHKPIESRNIPVTELGDASFEEACDAIQEAALRAVEELFGGQQQRRGAEEEAEEAAPCSAAYDDGGSSSGGGGRDCPGGIVGDDGQTEEYARGSTDHGGGGGAAAVAALPQLLRSAWDNSAAAIGGGAAAATAATGSYAAPYQLSVLTLPGCIHLVVHVHIGGAPAAAHAVAAVHQDGAETDRGDAGRRHAVRRADSAARRDIVRRLAVGLEAAVGALMRQWRPTPTPAPALARTSAPALMAGREPSLAARLAEWLEPGTEPDRPLPTAAASAAMPVYPTTAPAAAATAAAAANPQARHLISDEGGEMTHGSAMDRSPALQEMWATIGSGRGVPPHYAWEYGSGVGGAVAAAARRAALEGHAPSAATEEVLRRLEGGDAAAASAAAAPHPPPLMPRRPMPPQAWGGDSLTASTAASLSYTLTSDTSATTWGSRASSLAATAAAAMAAAGSLSGGGGGSGLSSLGLPYRPSEISLLAPGGVISSSGTDFWPATSRQVGLHHPPLPSGGPEGEEVVELATAAAGAAAAGAPVGQTAAVPGSAGSAGGGGGDIPGTGAGGLPCTASPLSMAPGPARAAAAATRPASAPLPAYMAPEEAEEEVEGEEAEEVEEAGGGLLGLPLLALLDPPVVALREGGGGGGGGGGEGAGGGGPEGQASPECQLIIFRRQETAGRQPPPPPPRNQRQASTLSPQQRPPLPPQLQQAALSRRTPPPPPPPPCVRVVVHQGGCVLVDRKMALEEGLEEGEEATYRCCGDMRLDLGLLNEGPAFLVVLPPPPSYGTKLRCQEALLGMPLLAVPEPVAAELQELVDAMAEKMRTAAVSEAEAVGSGSAAVEADPRVARAIAIRDHFAPLLMDLAELLQDDGGGRPTGRSVDAGARPPVVAHGLAEAEAEATEAGTGGSDGGGCDSEVRTVGGTPSTTRQRLWSYVQGFLYDNDLSATATYMQQRAAPSPT
ncbi:hypothetical protein PLESTF_000537100 [Pleodorina starrii]|nr:hypothetical protein PLESTF_000537100 [Pleodorina starrii]